MQEYINANYINGLVKDHRERSLIASSAPIPKTLLKFWKMIWQNRVPLIVMMCNNTCDKDDNKVKGLSMSYWQGLETEGETTTIESKFTLKLVEKKQLNNRLVSRLFEL